MSWLLLNKTCYYMTWVCSRSNTCSDWLIIAHYFPVMPTGRLRACKSQAKSHIIHVNNLLTSSVWSLRENLKPRPCHILSLGQYGKVSVQDFPIKTSLLVNK